MIIPVRAQPRLPLLLLCVIKFWVWPSVTSVLIPQALYGEASFVYMVFLHFPQILLIESLKILGFSFLGIFVDIRPSAQFIQ